MPEKRREEKVMKVRKEERKLKSTPHETRRTFVVEHPFVGPGSPPGPMVIDCGKDIEERRDEEMYKLTSLLSILLPCIALTRRRPVKALALVVLHPHPWRKHLCLCHARPHS